ncbi:phosphate ABC transporter permease subunit PstC [Pilimelia columellifera]|uniref:Phosphate transport system permease protein n=1 Tax=Pilimelia columellifera subsp. columellifera TaxID=706583 RepID=A0ABN3NF49_9ACTN
MSTVDTARGAAGAGPSLRRRSRPLEIIITALLVVAATVSVLTTIGIVMSLVGPTLGFFQEVSFVEFITGGKWTPTFSDKHYGVLPLVVSTLLSTAVAITIAVPLGLGSAIYLAEYASDSARRTLKPIMEILAGIPTVVLGFFALNALNPILRDIWPGGEPPEFQNLLVAGVVMGIMIVPTIASLSEDAMSAVPRSLREGAYALASSKRQVAMKVVVPAAISGIVASFVLGLSRALGETMIVTIAGGLRSDRVTFDLSEGAATMTAFIANIGQGDLPVGTLDYDSIFAVGALLFVFTFVLNAVSIRMVRKFREVYE